MPADVVAFLTTLSMALFTILSVLAGYLLLNSAVTNVARESSYYTFTRVANIISDSFASSQSSATNLYFTPKYVIFFAYFSDKSNVPFYAYDGIHLNDVAVNLDAGNDAYNLYSDIIASSTSLKILNDNFATRLALQENCVDDVCVCIGEVNSYLLLENPYLNPNACVEVCWGEYPDGYDTCLGGYNPRYTAPATIMTNCNKAVSDAHPGSACQSCVTYMNDSTKKFLVHGNGYDLLVLNTSLSNTNDINYRVLEDFSQKTKYSFITNVIDCKKLSDLALEAGRNGYCNIRASDLKPISHLFNYLNATSSGVIAMISTSTINYLGQKSPNNILFKLFNVNYYQNNPASPTQCYIYPSFINAEIRT